MNVRVKITTPFISGYFTGETETRRELTGRWRVVKINDFLPYLEFECIQEFKCDTFSWLFKKKTTTYYKKRWIREDDIDIIITSDIQDCNHE